MFLWTTEHVLLMTVHLPSQDTWLWKHSWNEHCNVPC